MRARGVLGCVFVPLHRALKGAMRSISPVMCHPRACRASRCYQHLPLLSNAAAHSGHALKLLIKTTVRLA
eukprot:757156-Pelagomonas_calceolata.AAC.2